LWKWSVNFEAMMSVKVPPSSHPGATIYPLHLHPEYHLKRRWRELKTEFLSRHLDYVCLTLETAERGCGLSPQGVQVWERALELLEEAKEKLMMEFGQTPPSGEVS
jgi:hypothetical protein